MHLVEYVPQITQVLTLTLHLKSREGYHLSGSILRYLLKYLGITIPSEYRSMPHKWDVPLSEFLPIRVCVLNGSFVIITLQLYILYL